MHIPPTYMSDIEQWTDITFSAVSALEDERDYYQKIVKQFENLTRSERGNEKAPVSLELFYAKLAQIETDIKKGYKILEELDKGIIPFDLLEPKRA